MSEEEIVVSLDPDTFEDPPPPLLSDVDITLEDVSFVLHEWKSEGKNPYLYASMNHEGESIDQYWSCGGRDRWDVSPDGKKLVAKGAAVKLSPKSNVGIFLASLKNAGYPMDKMDHTDVGASLAGMECHIQRVPQEGEFSKGKMDDGREFTRTIVTVTKIHKLPWEKKKDSKKAKKGKEPSAGLENKVEEFIAMSLAENPEGVLKKNLTKPVFAAFDGDDRNPALALVFDDEWLGDESRPWVYEDGIVKIA